MFSTPKSSFINNPVTFCLRLICDLKHQILLHVVLIYCIDILRFYGNYKIICICVTQLLIVSFLVFHVIVVIRICLSVARINTDWLLDLNRPVYFVRFSKILFVVWSLSSKLKQILLFSFVFTRFISISFPKFFLVFRNTQVFTNFKKSFSTSFFAFALVLYLYWLCF